MLKTYLLAAACTLLMAATLVFAANRADAASGSCGHASWYALTSITASGERMNPAKLTAAHRKLRFGTKVEVVNQRNGRKTVVRINDRGPFIKGRVIDLSKAAASKLGFVRAGVARVCFRVIG